MARHRIEFGPNQAEVDRLLERPAVGAAPVVLDAVGALVLRDVIPADAFDALIGPWQELTAESQ